MKIAAFPKCYLEDIARKRSMTVFEWITMSKQLKTEGLEMYEGFLESLDNDYIDSVANAIHDAGYEMPMMCCSPDLTNPDVSARKRAIDHEANMIRITARMGGAGAVCRVLTGQRYPDVSIEQGIEWVVTAICELIEVAREYNVILGLENHYKDGHWQYPEFAQKQDVFLRVLDAIPDNEHFGVQYDPSNAIVAGDDPISLLNLVAHRVVSIHASDRYLIDGATLDDIRQSDGTIGYSSALKHGVTGQGLNDYHAIFKCLKRVDFTGWISIEDGMNGLQEMHDSLRFLHQMRHMYLSEFS